MGGEHNVELKEWDASNWPSIVRITGVAGYAASTPAMHCTPNGFAHGEYIPVL